MTRDTSTKSFDVPGLHETRSARVGVMRGDICPDNDNQAYGPPDEDRWAPWQSFLFIAGICSAFWSAIIYGVIKLF